MKWTEARLQRLFRYYNTRYWQGKLPEYRVLVKRFRGKKYGDCNKRLRVIRIDVRQSDSGVRETMLHECCHAAHPWIGKDHHGGPFFREVYKLPEWFIARTWRTAVQTTERKFFMEHWREYGGSRVEVLRKLAVLRRRRVRK